MASVSSYAGRLYLLGRFPPKDGSPGLKQYKLTLQLDDTPINRRLAAQRLRRLEAQLKDGTFSWDDWGLSESSRSGITWQKAIRMLHEKKVLLGRTSVSTWDVSYMGRLKQLNPVQRVTTEAIHAAISKYGRHQCSYQIMYYLMKDIASLTGVPFPRIGVPLYGRAQSFIEVPSDAEIVEWINRANPPSRWYFAMMATYGLRPHEIDTCKFLDKGMVQVADETKTGYRTVIPLEEEWVELFNLKDKTPRPASLRESSRPDVCAVWLNAQRRKLGIIWKPYALRHAYAVRLWRRGGNELDLDTAAQLMGHSVKEHLETYRASIDPNSRAVAAQEAIARMGEKRKQGLEASFRRNDGVEVDS
jgi:integrase